MKMRLSCAFMSICLILSILSPVVAQAVTADDITTPELFLQYPTYLRNSTFKGIADNYFDFSLQILGRESAKSTFGTVVATMINNKFGLEIIGKKIASELGWGKDYEHSLMEDSALNYLSSISIVISSDNSNYDQIKETVKRCVSAFETFDNANTVREEINNIEVSAEFEEVLKSMGLKSAFPQFIVDSFFKKCKDVASTVTDSAIRPAIAFYQTVELYCLHYTIIKELLSDESGIDRNSDLFECLNQLFQDMQDVDNYFLDTYVRDTVVKGIINVAGLSYAPLTLVLACASLFESFYTGLTVEKYVDASYQVGFAQTLSNSLDALQSQFISGNGNEALISRYNVVYSAYIAALISALTAAGNIGTDSESSDAEWYIDHLRNNWSFELYLNICKVYLADDRNRQQQHDNNNEFATVNNAVSPTGVLPYGQPFNLRGVVSSGTVITNISAHIYNESGATIASYSINPSKTVYNIYSDGLNFDSQFRFGNFPSGNYRYVLSATNSAGTKEIINSSFSIGSAPQVLSVLSYEECDVKVQCPSSRIVNLYKNPTDTSRFTYFSKGQAPYSRRMARLSDGSTWYEVGVNHNNEDIKLWLKYENDITITDLSSPTPAPTPGQTHQPPSPEDSVAGWSAWSDTYASPSDTLEVETRQVVDVEAHTEYRYGRWTGPSIIWCKEYGQSLHGGSYTVEYSDWSSYRAYDTGTSWLCGHSDSEHSSHIGSIGPDSRGYPMWRKYNVNGYSNPDFFWEETRWVETSYKTQYRTKRIEKARTGMVTLVLYDNVDMGDIMCIEGQPYGDIPTPTREGYTFDGWYTLETGGDRITSSSLFTAESDYILYAHWTPLPPKVFTVSFETNGGYVDITTINVTEKEMYGQLPTPVRTDYTFDGWFTSSIGGSQVTSTTSVNLSGPQTLYAHWTKIPVKTFTVSFEPDGGTVSTSSKTVTNGETYGTLPVPQKTGYTFNGWYTSGSSLIIGSTIVSLSGPQTLYAHWIQDVKTLQFVDVSPENYFYDAVYWAVENQVTKGTTSTTFSPHNVCTKAHIITFLWRAFGSPEPTVDKSFSDVNSGSYYAKAAVWAYEKGLVSGDTFGGGDLCTRASAVLFLWQIAGSPNSEEFKFNDVPQNAVYAKAVSWAVSQGVTNGTTATTFDPFQTCSRGHIVTFLWRYFV